MRLFSSIASAIRGGELTCEDNCFDTGSSNERDRLGSRDVLRSVIGVNTLFSGTVGGSSDEKSSGGSCIANSSRGLGCPGGSSLFALPSALRSSELASGSGGNTGGLSAMGLCSCVPRIRSASMFCNCERIVDVRSSRTSSVSASSRSKNSICQTK